MKEDLSFLTPEEIESTNRTYHVQDQKPRELLLKNTTWHQSGTPTYSLICPKCGAHNGGDDCSWLWPRGVTKNNSRKLDDALDSNGDKLFIGFECENCLTSYDLIIEKRNGLQLRHEETGYTVYKKS